MPSPVRISAVAGQEVQPGNNGFSGLSNVLFDFLDPINVAGTLFIALSPRLFNGYVQFFVSTDNGATWAPDSSGVRQGCRNCSVCYNSTTGLFTVAYLLNANPGVAEAIQVRQYNPATQTWGANLAAGPTVDAVFSVQQRNNGDVLVSYVDSAATQYETGILSGGVWTSVAYNLGPGILLPNGPNLSSVIDSNNVLHVWAWGSGANTQYEYFRLLTNNTIDPNANGVLFPAALLNQNTLGPFAIDNTNNQLIAPYVDVTGLNIVQISGLTGVPVLSTFLVDNADTYISTISTFFNGPVARVNSDGKIYVSGTTFSPVLNTVVSFSTLRTFPSGPWARNLWIDLSGGVPINNPSTSSVSILPNGSPAVFFNAFDNSTGLIGRYTLAGSAPLAVSCNNPPGGVVGVPYTF